MNRLKSAKNKVGMIAKKSRNKLGKFAKKSRNRLKAKFRRKPKSSFINHFGELKREKNLREEEEEEGRQFRHIFNGKLNTPQNIREVEAEEGRQFRQIFNTPQNIREEEGQQFQNIFNGKLNTPQLVSFTPTKINGNNNRKGVFGRDFVHNNLKDVRLTPPQYGHLYGQLPTLNPSSPRTNGLNRSSAQIFNRKVNTPQFKLNEHHAFLEPDDSNNDEMLIY